jgi:hypothetical protein
MALEIELSGIPDYSPTQTMLGNHSGDTDQEYNDKYELLEQIQSQAMESGGYYQGLIPNIIEFSITDAANALYASNYAQMSSMSHESAEVAIEKMIQDAMIEDAEIRTMISYLSSPFAEHWEAYMTHGELAPTVRAYLRCGLSLPRRAWKTFETKLGQGFSVDTAIEIAHAVDDLDPGPGNQDFQVAVGSPQDQNVSIQSLLDLQPEHVLIGPRKVAPFGWHHVDAPVAGIHSFNPNDPTIEFDVDVYNELTYGKELQNVQSQRRIFRFHRRLEIQNQKRHV